MASPLMSWCTRRVSRRITSRGGRSARLVMALAALEALAALAVILCLSTTSSPARAQSPAPSAAAISGQVSTPFGQPAVSAQVRVCPITAMGAPCTPLATLYLNSALTVQQQNPLATDTYGNYKAFVTAGLYMLQVTLAPSGPVYTYYVSAGTSSTAVGSSAPPYSIQFASPTTGLFASDPSITIDPSAHILTTPELLVPGSGTGLIGLTGATSGLTVSQTVSPTTGAWTFTWPTAPAPTSGTNCLTGLSTGTTTQASFQPCTLSGAYLPLTGGTLTGGLLGLGAAFSSTNSVVNAASCGSTDPPAWCASATNPDIGAWINAAIASCSSQCTVYVPAGSYTQTTTIRVPMNAINNYELQLDKGAILSYTGSADIIDGYINTGGPTSSALIISGGTLLNTGAATAGIHLQPTNYVWISNMVIEGIPGPAIWFEGVNAAWIENTLLTNNNVGFEATPTFCSGSTCGTAVVGTAFTPNAIHIINNTIVHNNYWGVWFYDPVTNSLTGALNDEISGNDLELNGAAGPTYGAVNVGRSTGMVISRNYFEGSPNQIVLGILGGSDASTRFFASKGCSVTQNYFTMIAANPVFAIQLNDTDYCTIDGNSTLLATSNAYNAFMWTPVNNGTNIGETNTYFGHNQLLLGSGNVLSIGGTSSVAATAYQFADVGSFMLQNQNLLAQIVDGNWQTTAATTDVLTGLPPQINTSSYCYVTPHDGSANTASFSAYSIYTAPGVPAAGEVTVHHPATASVRLDLWCAYY
jgi:hypothetical protein